MQVSISKFKANPSRLSAVMRQGEQVQITSHGKVVAELVPPAPVSVHQSAPNAVPSDEEAMQRLMAAGYIAKPATKPLKLGKAVIFPPGPNGQTMSDLVIEMRGPR